MLFKIFIPNRYGSKRGLLNTIMFAFKLRFGSYRQCQGIQFNQVQRLVFICAGNICRSALAEYVAKHQGASAISFGLHTRGGDPADPRAITYAKSIGINMQPHITQVIQAYRLEPGDLLVGMEPKHLNELYALFGTQVPITLLGLWLHKPQAYLHDPYNTNLIYFNECERLVAIAAECLAKKLPHNG
jgi:protein-tyrosine phosphatase